MPESLTQASTTPIHDQYFEALWFAALLESTGLPEPEKVAIRSDFQADLSAGHISSPGDIRLELAVLHSAAMEHGVPLSRLAKALWLPVGLPTEVSLSNVTHYDPVIVSQSFPAFWNWATSDSGVGKAVAALYLARATERMGGNLTLLKQLSVTLDWNNTNSTIADNDAALLFRECAQFGTNRGACIEQADKLRRRFKNALLAMRQPITAGEKVAEDFFKHRLLDAEMQPCAMTARGKQATLAIQKLMHSAMMGMEPTIRPDDADRKQFTWRKNYRVWEAACKMFLYPENWLDPSYRIRKSPLLEAASSAVLQDELTEETAEKILHTYVSGLDEIANLDIRAMHVERATTPARIHVIARTHNPPYSYFYRVRTEENRWEAWKPIEIGIEGDHLFFAEYHRRLWLFWTIFAEGEHKQHQLPNEGGKKAPKVDIRLAYATLEFGEWSGKKICSEVLEAGRHPARAGAERFNGNEVVSLEPEDFYFWPRELPSGDLAIHCSRRPSGKDIDLGNDARLPAEANGVSTGWKDWSFVISGCGGPTKLEYFEDDPHNTTGNWNFKFPFWAHNRPLNFRSFQQKLRLSGQSDERNIHVRQSLGRDESHQLKLLHRYPDRAELVYPAERHALWDNPFFIDDAKRVHFAERSETCRIVNHSGVAVHEVGQTDTFEISRHYHPYACLMLGQLSAGGLDALYGKADAGAGLRWQMKRERYFPTEYGPLWPAVEQPFDVADFDFSLDGAYSQYEWEWAFHVPMLIAWQLKTSGKFADALTWLQYVFDPTDTSGAWGVNRPWQIKPFVQDSVLNSPFMYLKLIGSGSSDPSFERLRSALDQQIKAWRKDPFAPEAVAEQRIGAYKLSTALIYVETLIEWADDLFRRDTMESINEAANLYSFAAELLGPRPDEVDKGHRADSKSFAELSADTGWDDDLEALLLWPGDSVSCDDEACTPSMAGSLFPAGYFCVPQNSELPRLWDLVEDRLFKIRHCRNLAGEQRQLALYAPEIDPARLARARAAGLSLEDVVAASSEMQMPYRFQFLLGKAQDYCAEAKSLGGQLQAALEKKDAEELTLIRDSQGLAIQKLTRNLKKLSVEEAKQNLAAMQHSLASAQIQKAFLDPRAQELMNGPEQAALGMAIASDALMKVEGGGMAIASVLRAFPDIYAGIAAAVKTGGESWGNAAELLAKNAGVASSILRSAASHTSTVASYIRRREDWNNQLDQTQERIKELERQIIAAEIRADSAERDLAAFDLQIEQAEAVHDFLSSKFSGEELYAWTEVQLRECYKGIYELARKMALQAQLAFKNELNDEPATPISFNHWNSGKAGLLAADKLSFELKKLDEDYNAKRADQRLYELSRQVSLKLLDPLKLHELRAGNAIEFALPEWLFSETFEGTSLTDFRLRGLSISLPCMTGPSARVALKLTLLESWERPYNGSPAWKQPGNQHIKQIITSTAQGDSGRFEANPNSEGYLPFEYAGAVSRWKLELPADAEFDPETISDLVLSLRYTARDGENDPAPDGLDAASFPVSLRYDLNEQYEKLKKDPSAAGQNWEDLFPATKLEELTPYLYRGRSLSGAVTLLVLYENGSGTTYLELGSGEPSTLAPDGFSTIGSDLMHSHDGAPQNALKVKDIVLVRSLT